LQQLNHYNNHQFSPGQPIWILGLWILVSTLIFESNWFVLTRLKTVILRFFGASIGQGVVIKPHVRIKFPWRLTIGDYSWIGEGVWIDNLAPVTIGTHVCISQNAQLITGNHAFNKNSFDLMIKAIVIENQVWIGARTLIAPGVTCGNGSVLLMGSVLLKSMAPNSIYQGHPAQFFKTRI
jgi:putative colanic acid biosynthesis acetyltransferase WcaF